MSPKKVKKYAVVIFLLALSYLSILIVKPLITPILTSLVLAYLFYPIHKRISSFTKNKTLSAAIITLLLVLIILIPVVLTAISLIQESASFYKSGTIKQITEKISSIQAQDSPTLSLVISNSLKTTTASISSSVSKMLLATPQHILSLLMMFYIFFYVLLSGEELLRFIKDKLNIKEKEKLLKHLGDTTYDIVYGLFLIALIQAIITWFAFKIIGIQHALLLAAIVFILGFIPLIGPSVVYIPLTLFHALTYNYTTAIAVLIVGLIISAIEIFGRPKIIGNRTKTNPAIILVGIIGGLSVFGALGLILGPLILSFLLAIIEVYFTEK